MQSQPTRAAWIEIEKELKAVQAELASQPTRAAWIEIDNITTKTTPDISRSPLGLRGLKYNADLQSIAQP